MPGVTVSEKCLECRYVTLPYTSYYSKIVRKKPGMVNFFCKDKVNIKLVFTTCEVMSYLSTKDPLQSGFKSNVVYSFICARCHSSYVGRTHIHYNIRCGQHLSSDKNFSVFKHLANNKEGKEMNSTDSFKLSENAKTRYELALKEGMHIIWRKPVLNIKLLV